MKKIIFCLIIIPSLFIAAACAGKQANKTGLAYSVGMEQNGGGGKFADLEKPMRSADLTKEVPVTFKMVTMEEGLRLAEQNPGSIIVDVRRSDEYKAGHIPGAVLLTMEKITEETAGKVLPDKEQMILVYCRSGRRSKMAAQALLNLGYTNLVEFGGILDYKGKLEK